MISNEDAEAIQKVAEKILDVPTEMEFQEVPMDASPQLELSAMMPVITFEGEVYRSVRHANGDLFVKEGKELAVNIKRREGIEQIDIPPLALGKKYALISYLIPGLDLPSCFTISFTAMSRSCFKRDKLRARKNGANRNYVPISQVTPFLKVDFSHE